MPKFHTPTFPVDPHLTATSQEGVPAPGTLTYAASKEGKCVGHEYSPAPAITAFAGVPPATDIGALDFA